jgi:glycosyltransferase involved in cell wall biosynthesis
MLPEISVIIPIYNTESYIRKCIDSILKQDFTNYEIILIDDASTDASLAVINSYCDQYEFITLIKHNKNLGLGLTRNTGIEHAKGNYIFFIDSDDWIEVDSLSKMHGAAKTHNADIVGCGMWLVDELGNKIIYYSKDHVTKGGINTVEMLSSGLINTSACRLFRKSFIDQYSLRFYEYYFEDNLFMYEALYLCNKYVDIPDVLYSYLKRNVSITKMPINEKHVYSWIMLFSSIEQIILKYDISSQINIIEFKDKIYGHLKKLITEMLFRNLKQSRNEELSALLYKYKQKYGEKNYFVCTFIEMFLDQIKSNQYLLEFLKELKNKKLIVFGTGSVSEKLLHYMPTEITYFLDNNQKKWDSQFNNRSIFSPDCLLKENKDSITIIIASQFYQEISKQLIDMGFQENKHFWDGYKILS